MRLFSHRNQDTSSQRSRKWLSSYRVPLLLAFTTIFLAALVFRLGGASSAKAATFTLLWSDEFNGAAGTGVNTSNWIYDTGTGFGTGEIETMTTSTANVSQDGAGHLKITAIRGSNGSWTSGRIETQRSDFGVPAGGQLEITASLQQPNVSGNAALGYWPAFWTLGSPYRIDHAWPKDGEIDIMEDVNGLSSVYGTLHCGVSPGGPCNETSGIGSGRRACSGCQTGFHTYTVIVDRSISPEQIRWYLDGANYFTVSANQVDATTWSNAVDHAFFVIFDLAMGGGFPNGVSGQTTPTSATQSGASMLVDYVRVYTATGAAPTPTPTPTASGCSGTFTQGVNSVSSSSAQFWFKPCGWTAGYVIVHYVVPGHVQQNVQMTYNSGTARWEYTAGTMSPGQTITYSFTYQQNGLQHDTSTFTWTHP